MKALKFTGVKELRQHADTKSFFENQPTSFLTNCKKIEKLLELATIANSKDELEEAYVLLFRAVDLYQKLGAQRKEMAAPNHASNAWWKQSEPKPQYKSAWKGATANVMKIAGLTEDLKAMLKTRYEAAAEECARAAVQGEIAAAEKVAAAAKANAKRSEATAASDNLEVVTIPLPPRAGPSSTSDTSDLPPWATMGPTLENAIPNQDSQGDSALLLPLDDIMGQASDAVTRTARLGYGGCMIIDPAELYHLIEGQVKASVLIIDLRAKAQYKASHIESFGEFHLVNISPTFLSHGCIGQMIEDKMPPRKKDAKHRFSNRNTYDFIVLIGPSADDWNEPPTEYKLLIDAIVAYEPEKKLKRHPRCVDGGYAEFNLTYQALCSAPYIPEYMPRPTPNEATVDLNTLAYGATPIISRFQPAILTRQEQAAAIAAREHEDREREALATKLREREEHDRLAATAAAAESARLRQEETERANAASAAAKAARLRQEEELRATALAAEAAQRQRWADESARAEAATAETIQRQLQEQERVSAAVRAAEEDRVRAAAAAAAATEFFRSEEVRAAAAVRATKEQRDAERRAVEAAQVAMQRRQEQERAAEEARKLRDEHDRLAELARQQREEEERLTVEARSRRVQEERLYDDTTRRRLDHESAEKQRAATAAAASVASAAAAVSSPPPQYVAPTPVRGIRPNAPKPGRPATQRYESTNATIAAPPKSRQIAGAVVDRSSKPAHALTGRLSVEYRQARLRSMDAVEGSIGRGLTGLRNLGNTCFMNSIIQCVIAIAPLTKYFVQGRYRHDINRTNPLGHKGVLAEEFGEMAAVMWTQRNRYIAPRYFKSTLGMICPQFAGTKQQDSQEFCSFLLDGLHEDLSRVKTREYVEAPNTEGVPDNVAADAAWAHHLKRNQSVIVDLFQGQFKSTITCQSCNHKSTTFDPFSFLSLPLVGRHVVSMEQCLQAFSKAEMLTGTNKWHCPKCKHDRDAKKTIQIWRLPRILVVHLKRFYFEGPFRSKLDTHVEFPVENLDMSKHCHGETTVRNSKYKLFAVSNHIGDLSGGHYTAYCRSPFNNEWYKFDDSTVTRHTANVCTRQSYLLFYSSIDFRDHVDLF